jgi:hypothetical protein
MSKIITSKFTFLEYLAPSVEINQLQNIEQIESIFKVSDDGGNYLSWNYRNQSSFNGFNELATNQFYFIISKSLQPNFVLYEQPQGLNIQSEDLDIQKKYQFFTPKDDVKIKNFINRIKEVYSISQEGLNFLAWDAQNEDQFNSFFELKSNNTYLIISEQTALPYYIYSLFDKSSWQTLSEPYKSYLDQASDRWETYIRYSTNSISKIKNFESGWKGLRLDLNQYEEFLNSSSGTIAYSGPNEYIDLVTNQQSIKFNSVSFSLGINTYFSNQFNSEDWVNIMTHELGHALGIGIYWDSSLEPQGASPPANFFLDGQKYVETKSAYNSIVGLPRSKIPLEDSGGEGTASGHWENSYRSESYLGAEGLNYPGLYNELMVGWYSSGLNFVLSQLSIKCLVDFGYEEINIGSQEDSPQIVSNLNLLKMQNFTKLNCGNRKIIPKKLTPFNPSSVVS